MINDTKYFSIENSIFQKENTIKNHQHTAYVIYVYYLNKRIKKKNHEVTNFLNKLKTILANIQ